MRSRRPGFRGTTLDQIAELAGLSKPNLLYYFPSKEAIHADLLGGLLDTWLAPLRALDPDGAPGRRNRHLCADQTGHGAADAARKPAFRGRDPAWRATDDARDRRANCARWSTRRPALIAGWEADGRLAPVDPHHLIFSIWSSTQHYADFDIQVRGPAAPKGDAHFDQAAVFLEAFYRRALTPG